MHVVEMDFITYFSFNTCLNWKKGNHGFCNYFSEKWSGSLTSLEKYAASSGSET